jgi:acyl-CoA thioesterase FadM
MSSILKVGGKSVSYLHEMYKNDDVDPVARLEGITVSFDLVSRRAVELNGELRHRFEAQQANPPRCV